MSGAARPRVAIVGAGLGGLALAQALSRTDADIMVLERDASFEAPGRQVRIHCDAQLVDVVEASLPSEIVELFGAAQATPDARHLYLDPTLRVTGVEERPKPERVLDTRTSREVLATGLGDRLRFGADVHEIAGDAVVLSNGERLRADLSVVASGSDGTEARAAFASSPRDVGLLSWYGCADLDRQADLAVPDWLREGFVIAIGEDQVKVAMGLYEPAPEFGRLAERHEGVHVRRYAFWNVIAPTHSFLVNPSTYGRDPGAIARVLDDSLLRGWDAWLVGLIGRSDPNTIGTLALRTSRPGPPRPSGERVVYIGDAAHQMLPAALSTFVTFEDVAELAVAFGGVARSPGSVVSAVDGVSDRLVARGVQRVLEAEAAAAPAFGIDGIDGIDD